MGDLCADAAVSRRPPGPDGGYHDVLGIGFGPANMALAALLDEVEETAAAEGSGVPSRLFLEARDGCCWHPGMLLTGSLIQINVLKDLATVRNPRSRFTFLNYLQQKGRLFEFLNLRDLFPGRVEFNDYLGWVAEELAAVVRYGHRVVAVEAVHAGPGGDRANGGGAVDHLAVTAQRGDGSTQCHLTRNLVVATGGTPWVPDGVELRPGGRAFHTHEFLDRVTARYPDAEAPYRFVVVGGGQSGAELFDYLLAHYPNAEVTAALRRFGYKPVDESDFTNEVFFPHRVDWIYDLPEEKRRGVVASFRDVNYAVADAPLIRRIYRRLYDEKVLGKRRGRILPFVEVTGLREEDDRAVLELHHLLTDQALDLAADGVVLATGYRWSTRHPLLEGIAPWLESDGAGGYRVERDYGIATVPGFGPRIYLQGYCEATHGISETVLSLLPMRAEDIWSSVRRRLAAPARQRVAVARDLAAAAGVAVSAPG